MLYDHGFGLEVLNFHQLQMGRDTVTFIRGTAGTRDEWAMAWAEDSTLSALRALVACANVLAGGSIVVPPFDIQIGRCVVVRDPWGTVLVLLDMSKGTLLTDGDGNVIGNQPAQTG